MFKDCKDDVEGSNQLGEAQTSKNLVKKEDIKNCIVIKEDQIIEEKEEDNL